jgi:hypothetical protein
MQIIGSELFTGSKNHFCRFLHTKMHNGQHNRKTLKGIKIIVLTQKWDTGIFKTGRKEPSDA